MPDPRSAADKDKPLFPPSPSEVISAFVAKLPKFESHLISPPQNLKICMSNCQLQCVSARSYTKSKTAGMRRRQRQERLIGPLTRVPTDFELCLLPHVYHIQSRNYFPNFRRKHDWIFGKFWPVGKVCAEGVRHRLRTEFGGRRVINKPVSQSSATADN